MGDATKGASCFLGGGAWLGMRKGVMGIVVMCCFLKVPFWVYSLLLA